MAKEYNAIRLFYLGEVTATNSHAEMYMQIYDYLTENGREVHLPRAGKTVNSGLKLVRRNDLTIFNDTGIFNYRGATVSLGKGSVKGVISCPALEFVSGSGLSELVDCFIKDLVSKGLEEDKFLKKKVR